jgi:hypothetical protein
MSPSFGLSVTHSIEKLELGADENDVNPLKEWIYIRQHLLIDESLDSAGAGDTLAK